MKIKLYQRKSWIETIASKTIFVISPGAGVYSNRYSYKQLQKDYRIVYIGSRGDKYDKYPDNWQINKAVRSSGEHLGGLMEVFRDKLDSGIIPCGVITGSRGGQVTIGKVWENLWRGPTIIINAGCLTTNTIIPEGVFPLFITMEKDYFNTVNRLSKVVKLFYNLIRDPKQKAVFIHLLDEAHMPNLNQIENIFSKCFNFLINNSNPNLNNSNIIVKTNFKF